MAWRLLLLGGGHAHRPHCPARTLNLISTGDRHAIASWGPLSLQGHWAWR